MPKVSDSGRVILDESGKSALMKMYAEIKTGEHLRISPSKLVSWIMVDYLQSSFNKRKEKIKRDHFNPKNYLRSVVNGGGSDEDVESVLQEVLLKLRGSKKRGRPKKPVESI